LIVIEPQSDQGPPSFVFVFEATLSGIGTAKTKQNKTVAETIPFSQSWRECDAHALTSAIVIVQQQQQKDVFVATVIGKAWTENGKLPLWIPIFDSYYYYFGGGHRPTCPFFVVVVVVVVVTEYENAISS
jgi:hypothetical protein